jgi:hypothetical protein
MLELMVTCSIFALVIAVAYAIMLRGQDTFNMGATTGEVQERARLCMDTITRELLETSIVSVDTAQRTFSNGWGGTFSDNFEYLPIAFPAPVACLNPSCAWVYNAVSGTPRLPNAYLGQNYIETLSVAKTIVSVSSGSKVWPRTENESCPFCGSPFFITNPAYLDGVKFFTPRTVSGDFVNQEGFDDAPDWQGILFYFPYYNTETRMLELRRYSFYISDLFSEDPVTGKLNPLYHDTSVQFPKATLDTVNQTWPMPNPAPPAEWLDPLTHNPVGKPTLFDFLDTDLDGTIDIKHNVANAECMWEDFRCWNGQWLWFQKVGMTSSFWIQIDLATGRTSCSYQSGEWWRWCQFTRRESYPDFPGYKSEPPYTILGTNLADIQISTCGSNPYGSVANPLGVREENPGANSNGRRVRITMAFERPVIVGGIEYQPINVLQTEIWPRNR